MRCVGAAQWKENIETQLLFCNVVRSMVYPNLRCDDSDVVVVAVLLLLLMSALSRLDSLVLKTQKCEKSAFFSPTQ